jgi:hypothetical protein
MLLLQMKDVLPPEHYEYMRSVVKEGKAVSAEREAQLMLLILGRNLFPALLGEVEPVNVDDLDDMADELGGKRATKKMPEFRRDVTERLKVWNSLLSILVQIEKTKNDESTSNRKKPILEVFARSGLGGDRIGILVGAIPGPVGRDPDGVGGEEDSSGTLPDSFFERPLALPSGE